MPGAGLERTAGDGERARLGGPFRLALQPAGVRLTGTRHPRGRQPLERFRSSNRPFPARVLRSIRLGRLRRAGWLELSLQVTLRIGVVLDGVRAPAWAAWVLRAIHAHDDLELALAVIADRTGDEQPSILFAVYEALDRRVFSHPPDALEPVDISPALQGVSSLQLPAIPAQGDKDDQRHEDPDSDEHSLDVLVCLGTALAPGEIPLVPRQGVWSLHLGDPLRYRGEPALFWELFFAESASTSVLEAVAGSPKERRVLYQLVDGNRPRFAAAHPQSRLLEERSLRASAPRGSRGRAVESGTGAGGAPAESAAAAAFECRRRPARGQDRRAGSPAPAAPHRVSPPVVPWPSAATGGHPPPRGSQALARCVASRGQVLGGSVRVRERR